MKTIFKLAAACVCVGLISPGGMEASCLSGPHPGRRIGPPPHRMHKEPPACPSCGYKGAPKCGGCGKTFAPPQGKHHPKGPRGAHKEPPVCPNCGHKGPPACGKCDNPLPPPDRTKRHCQTQSHV